MKKERRIGFLAAVMVMSAALFSACGTINLPCLLGDCPTADKCGNGVVDSGETCDIAIAAGQPGACPVSCGDGNPCTSGMLVNPGTCTAMCSIVPCLRQRRSGDRRDLRHRNSCRSTGRLPNELHSSRRLHDLHVAERRNLHGPCVNAYPITTCSGTTKDGCCPAGCTNLQ